MGKFIGRQQRLGPVCDKRWPKGCAMSPRANPCQVECKAQGCNFPKCED